MKSLAIEREFGSGGREVGMKVAALAGIPYYDSALMVKAAEANGISVGMLEEYDEKRSGSFLYDLAAYTSYAQGGGKNSIYELFSGMQKTIEKLATEGPAVFIGRCSTEILKERSNVLRVFIYSSQMDKRIRRTVETEHVSEAEAKRLIDKKDKQRRNYFKFWTRKDWSDRGNYDLELNTSTLTTEECARILFSAMEK